MQNSDKVITLASLEADLTTKQAAAWFGYKCPKCFVNHCRKEGIPFREDNERVFRFDPAEIREWRKKRQLGLV